MIRHINVPYEVQRELLEEARWIRPPKGSGWINLASWSGNCMSSTGTAICFLPWNRNHRPQSSESKK